MFTVIHRISPTVTPELYVTNAFRAVKSTRLKETVCKSENIKG